MNKDSQNPQSILLKILLMIISIIDQSDDYVLSLCISLLIIWSIKYHNVEKNVEGDIFKYLVFVRPTVQNPNTFNLQ